MEFKSYKSFRRFVRSDGLIYKSNLAKGFNVAVFDLGAAELINCSLFKVKEVNLAFSEESNPYYIRKHYVSGRKE